MDGGEFDDPIERKELLDDPEAFVELAEQWAEECGVDVEENGLVTFTRLWQEVDCDVATMIGDLYVEMYHHTATGALESIRERGLVRADTLGIAPGGSGNYVFLTTEYSGPAPDGYSAEARHRFGGEPVMLTIRTRLVDLCPDPDDANMPSGATQFVAGHVPPRDIVDGL